jgi:hypothetical protein
MAKYSRKTTTSEAPKAKAVIRIYTWGSKRHKVCPIQESQKNINVAGISSYKPHGVNLKKVDGRDEKLQHHIQKQRNFDFYIDILLKLVKVDHLTTISIYCHKGRHRSVATAEILTAMLRKEDFVVELTHLDL